MSENFKKYTDPDSFSKIVDYKNVTAMWTHSVESYGESVAIIDGDEYTFSALDNLVSRFRTVLRQNEVTPGAVIGIFCPNSIGFVKAFLAASTFGVPAVLLPVHLDGETISLIAKKFNFKALVYDESLEDKLSAIKENAPSIKLISSLMTTDEETPAIDVPTEAPCAFLFTGGTTGKSKAVRLSQRAVLAGTKNGCYGIYNVFGEKYLLILPLTHVFGLIRNLMTSLYTGSTLFICRNRQDMFRDIAIFQPTILVLVPALAEMALNLSRQFKRNMLGDALKVIICGAAPVAPYLITEYDKLGIALLPGYGLTESANLVSGNPEALKKPTSVGMFYGGMDYKIVDGELWLKGVNMMDGYASDEDNALAYEDGWFKTGDLVTIDDDGYLYITGRTKEIIVLSSGENVSPAEIEVKFYSLDVVQDCLVYCVDEGTPYEQLVLEVLPRLSIVEAKKIDDIEAYMYARVEEINAQLPAFSRINKVIIRKEDFVRTPSMKIARNCNGNNKK